MSSLSEIEEAADSLPDEEKESLLRFLAMRLRKERALPEPRIYATTNSPPCSPRTKPMERVSGKALRVFLDSSVAVAACLSVTGASHEVFHFAGYQDWTLLVSPWVLRETRRNLATKPPQAVRRWIGLCMMLDMEGDD